MYSVDCLLFLQAVQIGTKGTYRPDIPKEIYIPNFDSF